MEKGLVNNFSTGQLLVGHSQAGQYHFFKVVGSAIKTGAPRIVPLECDVDVSTKRKRLHMPEKVIETSFVHTARWHQGSERWRVKYNNTSCTLYALEHVEQVFEEVSYY